MSKYKVGDVVKLRDDLEAGKYGKDSFVKEMGIMKNNPIKIIDVNESDYLTNYGWYITDEMIEGLWEECNNEKNVTATVFENMNNNDNFLKQPLKLIDVLNMIAKGELKEGSKVIWDVYEYTYKKGDCYDEYLERKVDKFNYVNVIDDMTLMNLNAEVELIEPPCEHEWEDIETHRMGEGRIRRYRRCNKCGLEEETEDNHFADVGKMAEPTDNTKIEELDMNEFVQGNAIDYRIGFKLNEVINKVNAQTTVLLAQDKYIKEIQEELDY